MMKAGNISEKLRIAANQDARGRNYWLNRLAGMSLKKGFPYDYKKKRTNRYLRDTLSFTLEEELVLKLLETTGASDRTLNLVLIAGLTLLLDKYTGRKDIIIGTPIYKQDIEGEFINTVLVLRNIIQNDIPFKEFIDRVRRTILEGTEHQNYPIELLIKELHIDTDTGTDVDAVEEDCPLFDAAILLENIHDKKYLRHNGCNMIFVFKREGQSIRGIVEYNALLYEKTSVENIVTHFGHLLYNALCNAYLPLREIEMLTAKEKRRLLNDFNHTAVAYPGEKTIVHLFEEQAGKSANFIAVSSPMDLSDIYDQLESGTLPPYLARQMETLCFQKNTYLYRAPLPFAGEDENTTLKILKTRRHNSVIVNRQVVRLMDLFDGRRNLQTLYSWLKDLKSARENPVEFLIYSMPRGDLLEISFQFDNTPESFSLDGAAARFEDFVQLVKSLYRHHLLELVGVETGASIVDIPGTGYFPGDEVLKLKDTSPPATSFMKNKEIVNARVLLLGDTPGTSTTGLLYLGAYLKRNGIDVYCQFYDPARDYGAMKKNIETLLRKIRPAVVGISLKWFLYIARVMDMCRIVKECSPAVKIVLGGNTASYYWEEMIKYDCIDYLVRGDGEEPLLQICRGEDEAAISNCVYKKNGETVENPVNYIQDETNSAAIYLSHLDEIMLSNHAARFGTFFIYTHKGCAMNCLYCGGCNSAQKKTFHREKVFKRGVAEIRKDILAVREYASSFQFEVDIPDENLPDYCRQIWQDIDLSGHFCIFSTLTPPPAALIELVSRTFKYVYWDFDICTPCERHRKQLFSLGLVKPQPSDGEILNFMAQCERYPHIEVRLNLITGLPYFTREDIETGEKFLSKLMNTYSCFGELHWARLHAQPGAPIIGSAEKHQMHSYALTFADFLRCSEENFNRTAGYSAVENLNYPYIYFKDDRLNSRVTNFYLETDKKADQHRLEKKRGLIVNQTLTYRGLNEKAGRLAGILRAKGVKPGDIVGLMPGRSLEIAVGILGILKAGCAYMPIDPEFPRGRIKYMLKDSNAKVLVGEADKPGEEIEIVNLSELSGQLPAYRTHRTHPIHPAHPCYVIYTSGTTGKPRGVILEHRNLVNYVYWFSAAANLSQEDRTVLTSSFAYDLGYTSLYTSLSNGGQLHILPRETYLLAGRLLDYIRRKGITYIKVTPSLFSTIVNSANFSAGSCESLRLAAIGGEAINVQDIEKAHSLCSHLQIMNHYGPTEATIGCVATFVPFRRFGDYKAHPVIGGPINNMRAYILDGDRRILPTGVPGELCIAGDGLAKGYLNRPALTSEKFNHELWDFQDYRDLKKKENEKKEKKGTGKEIKEISPSLNTKHLIRNTRLYRTGDLARRRPDGTIEFLGRIDNQVKVRGYRIELEEIESRLKKHPRVEEAAAAVKEAAAIEGAETGTKFLCAYFVPKQTAGGTAVTGTPAPASDANYPGVKREEPASSISERFKKKVTAWPRKIAVKSKRGSLTYQSLDDYSNRTARKILEEYDDRYKLSQNERERYKRQMLLYGWGVESQEKLKGTTVFVAGAGGGASPTIMQLALAGFGTIIVCDCDEVELSNLNRQFLHDESRIGMNKALSAKMTIERINPNVNVIPLTRRLTRENVSELVADAEIIFDMFDGQGDKFILSGCAAAKNIPHIISAMTDINGYTAVFHPPRTPCFHCLFDKNKLDEVIEGMSRFVDKYEKNPLPVAATSLFMSTAFAVNEAIKIILGFENPAYNRFIFFNQGGTEKLAFTQSYRAMTYTFSDHFQELCKEQGFDWDVGWRGNFLEELKIEADPHCPLCSKKEKKKTIASEEKNASEVFTGETRVNNRNTTNTQTAALLLNHDIDMAAGLLGTVKAGKTCVPLDPDSSSEASAFILEDSGARIILTDDDHCNQAEKLRNRVNRNIKIINIGRLAEAGANAHEAVESEKRGDRPAYVLYPLHTGGSTGKQPPPYRPAHRFNAGVTGLFAALLAGTAPYLFEDHTNKKEIDTPGVDSLSAELQEYLREDLPVYMVPAHFIRLDHMPLTPNGKVDRNALPDPRVEAGKRYTAPACDVEEKIAGIWSEVLGKEKDTIGVETGFFELGGHSLNAAVMTARIHKELKVKLSLAQVFSLQTIRALSGLIRSAEEEIFVSIKPTEEKEYYPLSAAQNRMFLIKQLIGDDTAYNTPQAFTIEGGLDKEHFEKIVKMLIRRHESFRTSFEIVENTPIQRIHPAGGVDFTTACREIPATGDMTEQKVETIIRDFIRPFDLSRAPLLRVGLVTLTGEKHLLIYDFHHIIRDLVSTEIFIREFIHLYQGGELPPLRLQYKDFSTWQNNRFQSGGLEKQEKYWSGVFHGEIPVLNLPLDYPRPGVLSFRGDEIDFEFGSDIAGKLGQIREESGATLYMIVLAIYSILAARYSGQEDIIVGCPAAGRDHSDLENMVGILLNTLALRNYPAGEKTFMEFLEEVRTNTLNAYANQDYPFEELLSRLNIKPDPGRHPLFDVMLAWQNVNLNMDMNMDMNMDTDTNTDTGDAVNGKEISGLVFKPCRYTGGVSQFDINAHAVEADNNIFFKLRYRTKLFKRQTMENFAAHFKEIANYVANDKHIKLKDIRIFLDFDSSDSSILKEAESHFAF